MKRGTLRQVILMAFRNFWISCDPKNILSGTGSCGICTCFFEWPRACEGFLKGVESAPEAYFQALYWPYTLLWLTWNSLCQGQLRHGLTQPRQHAAIDRALAITHMYDAAVPDWIIPARFLVQVTKPFCFAWDEKSEGLRGCNPHGTGT